MTVATLPTDGATVSLARQKLQNLEAEQNILGSLLFDSERLEDVSGLLEPESFAESFHQDLFDAIAKAVSGGRRADPATVVDRVRHHPAFEAFGGFQYLGNLLDHCGPTMLRQHAELVADLATRRKLVAAAEAAIHAAPDPDTDAQAQIAALEAGLAEIASRGADDAWIDGGSAIADAIAQAKARDGVIRYTWGIDGLDDMTGGLNAGESVILAGRPGSMKTGVAARIALANARRGLGTALISLEMSAQALGLRMACATAHDRTEPLYSGQPTTNGNPWYVSAAKGNLTREQWDRLDDAQAEIARLPLLLDARPGLTMSRIESAVRRAHRKWRKRGIEPGPVVIDHLGIVRPEKARNGNKTAEVADVSRHAAEMAKRLGVPVVALCQLNRGVEGRDDKRPQLSDLRQAGELEEDARAVVMIYRPAYYLRPPLDPSKESPVDRAAREAAAMKAKGVLQLVVEKNSHGPTGIVEAWCDPATSAVGNREIDGGAQ